MKDQYEKLIRFCLTNYGSRVGVLVPTYRFFKQSIFQPLMYTIPPVVQQHPGFDYSRAHDRIVLPNDSTIQAYSVEQIDRIRGHQFHGFWVHPAALMDDDAINQCIICTRLQETPLGIPIDPRHKPDHFFLA